MTWVSHLLTLLLLGPMLMHGKIIQVQGHRGARGQLPENTLPGFAHAIEAGVDVLELDLLMTQDNKIVIYHDFFLSAERIAYLDGCPLSSSLLIRALPFSQIKQFDCGRKANALFPKQKTLAGTPIPALDALFEMINASIHPHAKTVRLNLEIKRDLTHPEYSANPQEMAQQVLALVQKYGFENRVYYSSFDPESLMHIRALDPDAKLAFLKEEDLDGMLDVAQRVKAEVVSPEHVLIHNAEEVRFLQRLGYKVILWTVNDPKRWDELIDMGVDGIITDYPDDLISFMQSKA